MMIAESLALILGFYMAWNIGANDVANAMGTSVGSRALTLGKAVFLAAILEFAGAFFVGGTVCETIQKEIIAPETFQTDPHLFILGRLGALLATGILLHLASYFGLPLSTTHAIVGAVVGFGIAIGGIEVIHWNELGWIALSWVLSPLLSGLLSYLLFSAIQKKILFALNPTEATQKLAPFFVFLCFTIAPLSLLYEGLAQLKLDFTFAQAFPFSIGIGIVASLISAWLLKKLPQSPAPQWEGFHPQQAVSLEKAVHHLRRAQLSLDHGPYSDVLTKVEELKEIVRKSVTFPASTPLYSGVEKIFVYLQILSACLVAFAHGANDVANAIGPVAAIFSSLKSHTIASQSLIPPWLLALGGGGIVLGLATWGWRVIETIGKKITELTPTRGFAAEFGAACTILLASKFGLPISTTHALVGSVFGVGMARGLKALNLQTLKEIFISWIVTIPLCALVSIFCFYLLKFILY